MEYFKDYIDSINEGLIKTHDDNIVLKNILKSLKGINLSVTGEKDENISKLGKKFFGKDISPIVYEIDNSDKFIDKLYIDVNYDRGYYTLNNIPPDKLKLCK